MKRDTKLFPPFPSAVARSTSAQLTGFILLGAVVLVLILTVFVLTKASQVKKVEQKVDVVQEQLRQTAALDNYIVQCLDRSVRTALTKIMKQGGMYVPSSDVLLAEGDPVELGIAAQERTPPPDYPYPKTPLERLPLYPFGKVTLPPLCEQGGPNDAALNEYAFPCPDGSYGADSIQNQTGKYAAYFLQQCVNTEDLQNLAGGQIETGQPQVEIVLGKEDVAAIAHYPFKIVVQEGESTRLLDFQTVLPIRLKRLYGLASFLASTDRTALSFDPTERTDREGGDYRSAEQDEMMSATRRDADTDGSSAGGSSIDSKKGDVITITDKYGNGTAAVFRFARINRRPALDYIHQNEDGTYDIRAKEGEAIILHISAIDPDEDSLLMYKLKDETGTEQLVVAGPYRMELGVGTYEIKVTVCDDQPLCDWQNVKILVSPEEEGGSSTGGSTASGASGTAGRPVGSIHGRRTGTTTAAAGTTTTAGGSPASAASPATSIASSPAAATTGSASWYGSASFMLQTIAAQARVGDNAVWNGIAIAPTSPSFPFPLPHASANDIFRLDKTPCTVPGCSGTRWSVAPIIACQDAGGTETGRCIASKQSYTAAELRVCAPAGIGTTFEALALRDPAMMEGGTGGSSSGAAGTASETSAGTGAGICNPTEKPTNPASTYGNPGPYGCKATCTATGQCSKPASCICRSGSGYSGDAACAGIRYEQFSWSNYARQADGTVCTASCKVADLNADRAACEFSRGPGAYVGGECCSGCVTAGGTTGGECLNRGAISRDKNLVCTIDRRVEECAAGSVCRSERSDAYADSPYGYVYCTPFGWQASPASIGGRPCAAEGICRLDESRNPYGYYACE